jgi:hypothetical protein
LIAAANDRTLMLRKKLGEKCEPLTVWSAHNEEWAFAENENPFYTAQLWQFIVVCSQHSTLTTLLEIATSIWFVWLVFNATVWKSSHLCFQPLLTCVFVTHFLSWHQLAELCYQVIWHISVELGYFKLFRFFSARGLRSCVTAVISYGRAGNFVGDQKWHLILLSLTSYLEWNVLLHVI